jgi:hypothetical protein
VSGWPAWLDQVEQIARVTDTCLEHMAPYKKCRRGHLIRAALRDLWRAIRG